ncbi:KGG domain-containing protein [Pseudoduganella chitinolytica]|uniref:KGG domain-containing protein n=1 Tax=Pseudoduganella chitinolytica TaxID=34070 RepID=A0ABY8BHF5_9BURK|nr:KGG domain-containing protein [Pseudoduganella chitinolytica]WEF35387.1 KGG domain-containing protein [Pseudoduganella chitinolytica]
MATNQVDRDRGTDAGNVNSAGGGNSQRGDSGTGQKSTAKRGFAAMDEATQRQIASKGGQAAHQKGTAHEFDSEEARRAGQKGGEAVSRDREHMAEIGRKGGESRQSANRGARQGAKEDKR